MGGTMTTLVLDRKKREIVKLLLLKYGDTQGETQLLFESYGMTLHEQFSWLQLWDDIDTDGSNLVDFEEFTEGFDLRPSLWAQRLFSQLDEHYTGTLSFVSFLRLAPALLVYDKLTVLEVAYKTISRRGASFSPLRSVLDEK
ncbi:unnamed protein product, partial [Chrysoparadoxa australica]